MRFKKSLIAGAAKWLIGLSVCLVSGVTGCGGQGYIRLVPAAGVVTLNNDPVPDASVVFEPASGSAGKLATGRTNARGEFALYTDSRAGAACGRYNAAIISDSLTFDRGAGSSVVRTRDSSIPAGAKGPAQSSIPGRYVSPATSGLVYDISMNASNQFLIRLVNP